MTRDQLISMVLARLGQRQKDTKLQAAAVAEQQLIQAMNLEKTDFKPWFLLSEYEETLVKAGEYKISLPEHFLEEWEEGTLYMLPDPTNPATRQALIKKDYEDSLADPNDPNLTYAISGTHFLLPLPLTQDTIFQMRYYKGEPIMNEDYALPNQVIPENKWTMYAPDWYMAELGFILASHYTMDDASVQKFTADIQTAKHRCFVETIARMEANASRTMGGDD